MLTLMLTCSHSCSHAHTLTYSRSNSNLSKFILQSNYIISKFNLWCSSSSSSSSSGSGSNSTNANANANANTIIKPKPLTVKQKDNLFLSIQSYYEPQPWKLSLKKDNAKG